MEEINHYAAGGFDILTDWFDDRPRHLETFLPRLQAASGGRYAAFLFASYALALTIAETVTLRSR